MRKLFVAWLLLLPGCVIHLEDDHPDWIDDSIRDVSAEVNVHHANMLAVVDMDGVRGEVARHRAVMDARVATLEARLDDVYCDDWNGMNSMGAMCDVLDSRRATYEHDVGAATTVEAARSVSAQYTAEMGDMLGHMMWRWSSMDCGHWW